MINELVYRKKVVLYYPWIYLKGGAERLITNLVANSRHDWTIYTNHYDKENTFPEFKKFNVIEISRVSVKRKYSEVTKASLKIIKQKIDLHNYDVVLIINEGVGSFFNFRNHSKPVISICLTPLKVIHDPFTRDYYLKNNKNAHLKFLFFSLIFKILDKIAWSYYKRVICISEEVKKRVLKANLAKNEKIEVIHPGINLKGKDPSWVYKKYFLIPGRIMWQKNIELAIEAFNEFYKQMPESGFELIIAGMVDEKSQPYLSKLKILASDNPNIQFLISPNDSKFFELYKNCYAILFTSLNEDWGMVVLEAMAYGKPVICTNRGGPNESVINGKTGFLVEPEINDFVEKMKYLVDNRDEARKMGVEANIHIKQFSLFNFVNKVDNLIDKF